MKLDSARYLKDRQSGQTARLFNTETGWNEVRKGLGTVIAGYCVLVIGSPLAVFLLSLAVGETSSHPVHGKEVTLGDYLILLGMLALALTALGSYGLVIWGQWKCLHHAPERQNAKELMFVTFITVIVCSALSLVGAAIGGQDVYGALRAGADGLNRLSWRDTGAMLILGSAVLGLLASMVFSQFLRTIACCFGDEKRAKHVDFNLMFVGLLVGTSVGAVVCLWDHVPQSVLLSGLAAGWLLCLGWHLLLIVSIRRGIQGGLRYLSGMRKAISPQQIASAGTVKTQSLSGLRRLLGHPPA